jgi:hypothetical protein
MLVHSLALLSFSVMVIIVFYLVPASFNLIAKGNDIKKIPRGGGTSGTFNYDEDYSIKGHNNSLNNNNVERLLKLHLSGENESRKQSSPRSNRLHHMSNSNSTLRM